MSTKHIGLCEIRGEIKYRSFKDLADPWSESQAPITITVCMRVGANNIPLKSCGNVNPCSYINQKKFQNIINIIPTTRSLLPSSCLIK